MRKKIKMMNVEKEKRKYKHKPTLGRQCAAWGCFSRALKEQEGGGRPVSSGITFFKFPQDKNRRKLWCNRIKRVDGKDGFNVTFSTLCEKHFKSEDVLRAPGGTRKKLKPNATPYLTEELVIKSTENTRKAPIFRPSPRKKYREEEFETTEEISIDGGEKENFEGEIDWGKKYNELSKENKLLKEELQFSRPKIKFIESCLMINLANTIPVSHL